MEMELADIVYVFSENKKIGFKFYDRTPSGAVAKFSDTKPDGFFITDASSISGAQWDDEINKPNEESLIRLNQGEVKVKTIMVLKEKMSEILDYLASPSVDEDRIIIDTRELNNVVDLDNKHNSLSNLDRVNNFTYFDEGNNLSSFDEYNNIKKQSSLQFLESIS